MLLYGRDRFVVGVFFLLLALRAPLELCGPSFLRAGRRRDNPAVSKHHPPAPGIPSKAWLRGSAASGSRLRLWWVSWRAMKPPLVTPLRQTPAPPALRWSFVKVSFPKKGLIFNASQWTFATFCTEHFNTSYLIIAAFYFPLSRKGSLLPLAWRLRGLIRASERAATQFVQPCAASQAIDLPLRCAGAKLPAQRDSRFSCRSTKAVWRAHRCQLDAFLSSTSLQVPSHDQASSREKQFFCHSYMSAVEGIYYVFSHKKKKKRARFSALDVISCCFLAAKAGLPTDKGTERGPQWKGPSSTLAEAAPPRMLLFKNHLQEHDCSETFSPQEMRQGQLSVLHASSTTWLGFRQALKGCSGCL